MMHSSWFMGHLQWLELALFGLLAVITSALLTQCRLRHVSPPEPAASA